MRMHIKRPRPQAPAILALIGTLLAASPAAVHAALTMKSPEVLKAVERGVGYLASKGTSDNRLGACALAGMSLLTYGESEDHPMVVKCAEAIQKELAGHNPEKLNASKFDIYSTGMCVIFLVDRAPDKHRADIECLLAYLRKVQKPHGGWGYANLETGDTSMTQYGVLASWVAIHEGFTIPGDSLQKVATWLLRTQDPTGGYGYQGKVGDANKLVTQTEVKPSLSAAGLGSLYACAELMGMSKKVERRDDDLPPGMKEIKPKEEERPRGALINAKVDSQLVQAAMGRGEQWFAKNFKVDQGQYNHYYIYAFERYKSFQEDFEKNRVQDPQWYSDIAAHLLEKQKEDGSWIGDCGVVPDTAFAVLFLMRSMRKKLEKAKNFGDGLMVGGRGLPKDTSKAMLNADGQVVSRPLLGPADRLLAALENPEIANIDDSVDLVAELPAEQIETLVSAHGDVLRRLVGNQSPKARLGIVQALGKTRNLDNVEVLIYAMTDPVPEVALAAHQALLRTCRNPDAVALPQKFTEEDRRAAIDKWKDWYRSIRPDAKFEWSEGK